MIDSLPAHKKANVRQYVASTEGRLTLHFLPGYAPDLNPDELVWSHVKRTGTARRPCQRARNCATRSRSNLPNFSKCPTLFAHSSKLRLSPILATAE